MKKLETRFYYLSLLCAYLTTLFGVLALIGWYSKVSFLVQLTPLAFIQTNTALCFLLTGVALLLVNRSQFRIAQLLSLIILIFGVLTLCQYIFNISFGIDELLFKDFIHSGASHPNRMAPNTALCFSLLAVALFIYTYSFNSKRKNLIIAILATLVFVVASGALTGFLIGLEAAFGWGEATRMSPQTAMAFMVSSSGIIFLVLKNILELEREFPGWSAFFASLAVITVFIGIWQTLVLEEQQYIKSDIKLKHEIAIHEITFELKERTYALNRMGKRFEINHSEDDYRIEWEADVVNYVNHFHNFKSLDWVDPGNRVQWSVAPDGNEEGYGVNLMDDQRLAPAMNIAREKRETWISPVLNTPQQEKVFSIFVPLFEGEKFIGFIRGQLMLESFLQSLFANYEAGILNSIYRDGKLLFSSESGEAGNPEKWRTSSTIEYKGLNWVFQSMPSKAYLSNLKTMIPEVVMIFGVIFAWALGAAIRSSQRAKGDELELISINQRLTEEYAKGQQQSKELEVSQKKYKTLFSQVKAIIEEVSSESGEGIYASLVQNLAVSLDFKYCLIAELDALDDRKVNTIAVWANSGFMENFSHSLSGTPCENVVAGKLCAYSSKVWVQFPEDKILCDLGIESYVGLPLYDSSNNTLGILCVMHDEKIEDLANAKLILPLFADVAESEMERQVYEKKLQRGSEMVRVSRDIAMAANDFPNAESTLKFALQKFCHFMGWPVGHLYLREDATHSLVPTRIWYFEDPLKYQILKMVTEETVFERGEGLPGRVMMSEHPEWVRDVYADPNFPRAEKSDHLGIRSALACPIIIRKKVMGVMEFFTPQVLEMDGEVLDLVEQVGIQVARVLERNKAEEILKQQAQVLEHIHDAVISLDNKFNITAWNKGAERVLGFKEEEVLGKPISYLFPDAEEALAEKLMQPTIIHGRYETEMEMIHKSGGMIYAHISLSALCDQNCVLQSIIFYALDITEKKHAKEQLELYSYNLEKRVVQRTAELNASVEKIKESRDQIEGILKSIGEGLIVADLKGVIVLMNPQASNILGVKVEDALGRAADKIIQNQTLLRQIRYEGEAKALEKPFDIELQKDDGAHGRSFVRGVSTSIRGAEGNFMGSVTVLHDATFERKVDSLKSQFLSTAAHELRTPLTTLQGFSEILLNKKNLPAESVKRYLKYINDESLKLGKIINDFLDISRIESGREIAIDKKKCAVCHIIDQSARMFGEAYQASHEFVFQYQPEAIKWNVDLEKMEQVFKNLYSNAIKYSPDGGKITTSVRSVNGHTEVVVEDQGIGMTAEQVGRIFDRFYRGENLEDSVSGSGLGMTIVKYIIEAHGGNVKVESEFGKGTRVTMCVPK